MVKKRPRFKKNSMAESTKWVACISCGQEYVIEPYAGIPECPICESRLYEDVECYPLLSIRDDYNDY